MRIEGRIVLITGGGGGIGGGIAQAFAEKGARIVLADISADHMQEAADRLPQGTIVELLLLDVTSLESWAEARARVEERLGPIDVLCNNAGIALEFKPLTDMAQADFERAMAVNVNGVFNGVKTFVPGLVERGRGHIVNTASINGLLPHGGTATYTASKFAVTGLSDALRQELAGTGVGVSTLFPGLTRSRMAEASMARLVEADPERAARTMAAMIEPVEVGRGVVRAVETNQPYIMTHAALRLPLTARSDEILAAFDEAVRPDR